MYGRLFTQNCHKDVKYAFTQQLNGMKNNDDFESPFICIVYLFLSFFVLLFRITLGPKHLSYQKKEKEKIQHESFHMVYFSALGDNA